MVLRPIKVETRDIVQGSRRGKMIADSLMSCSPLAASLSAVHLIEAFLVFIYSVKCFVSSSVFGEEKQSTPYTTHVSIRPL